MFTDVVDWDAEAYSHKIPNAYSAKKEDLLQELYKLRLFKVKGAETLKNLGQKDFGKIFAADRSAPIDYLTEPAIIIDIFGWILLWYLPSILSIRCQEGIWSSSQHLQEMFLPKSSAPKSEKTAKPSWRKANFVWPSDDMASSPGSAIFSLGWFMQGNDIHL
jgi:hypothetical protein